MSTYNIIAASNESTVVAEYTPESSCSDSFQSEAALEKEFIRLLTAQGYEYLTIHDENSLIANESGKTDSRCAERYGASRICPCTGHIQWAEDTEC